MRPIASQKEASAIFTKTSNKAIRYFFARQKSSITGASRPSNTDKRSWFVKCISLPKFSSATSYIFSNDFYASASASRLMVKNHLPPPPFGEMTVRRSERPPPVVISGIVHCVPPKVSPSKLEPGRSQTLTNSGVKFSNAGRLRKRYPALNTLPSENNRGNSWLQGRDSNPREAGYEPALVPSPVTLP